MPIFEYQCEKCAHVTTFLEKLGDPKTHVCEECGSQETKKLFSVFAAKVAGPSSAGANCPTGTCPLS